MLTVITGPPCSGKSTYAREHAQPGDIVIDWDLLVQALGSPVDHDHPEHIGWVATAARRAAVREAIRQHHRGATAWIIHSRIPAADRDMYIREGAHIITLTADPDELHARAIAAGRPARWHQLIDEWTPDYQPRTPGPRQPRAPRTPRVRQPNPRKGRPYRRWRTSILAASTICWICGHDGADSADHLDPLAHGGALLDPDNGAPAHHEPCPTCGRRCNTSRGARPARTTATPPPAHATPITNPTW